MHTYSDILTHPINREFISSRRSVILDPVSDALFKSPTVCNAMSQNTCFPIDYNLEKTPELHHHHYTYDNGSNDTYINYINV